MKLSLMVINLFTNVFMDENFRPKADPDINKYEAVLKLAHDAGFDAIDMTDLEFIFGVEKVKELMDKYGLSCGSVIFFENYTCVDKAEQKRVFEHTKSVIDNAAQIGCKTIMLVAAGAVPGLPREHLQQGMAENLSKATEYAKSKGITICIEDFPSTQIPMCSISDIRYLLDNVDGLKLTYDTANMLVEGESPDDFFEAFKNDIGYCHLKDVRISDNPDDMGDGMRDGRKMITTYHGTGIIDFEDAIKKLASCGYEGYMSVEYAYDGNDGDLLEIIVGEREYLEGYKCR